MFRSHHVDKEVPAADISVIKVSVLDPPDSGANNVGTCIRANILQACKERLEILHR